MRIVAVVFALALLGGCSGRPEITHAGKTEAEARADYEACQTHAAMAAAFTPMNKDYEAAREKALDECMKAKGYKVE